MFTNVTIKAKAWNDPAFAILARLLGLADAHHALIKTALIWSWQTEHYTPEKPTYVVERDIIEVFLGPGGADAMVRAKLATEEPEGFRIAGCVGEIEWLYAKKVNAKKGGEATQRKHRDKRGPIGLPAGKPNEGRTKAYGQAPASGSASGPDHVSEREPARARDPSTPYTAPGQDTQRDQQLRDIVARIGPLHAEAFNRVRSKLGSTVPGRSVVGRFDALRELLRSLPTLDDAMARCEHAIAIREREAVTKQTLEYFGDVMWSRVCFDRACSTTLQQAGGEQRAGPRSVTVGYYEPLPFDQMGPTGDLDL